MDYETIEGIEKAMAKLEEDEKLNQKRLETFVSKQYQLEAMLKNITKSIPRLQEVSVDAEKLSEVIKQTANLAESVSEKVRRLDITRSRVSECQQRVHDLLDLQLCSEGVQTALMNEDYEKAAAHVHRFLSLDQNVLKQTADNFAEDKTNVTNSFTLLQEVTEKLRMVVAKKFNEAIVNEDLASVERFFKIYPLLNLHKEGIAQYALYMANKLRETSKNNLKTALDTNRYDSKPNIIFSDTLNLLLEGTARIIETCQPLVDTYYGPGKILLFVAQLQKTCDSESVSVLTELLRNRQLEKKVRQVNEYQSNSKSVEKLEAKALSLLLTELTTILVKVDLYFKYLKRRVLNGLSEDTEAYKSSHQELCKVIDGCVLKRQMQDILGYYVLLETYFMEESVNKAISLDSRQDSDVCVSTMVDDVYFIVRKSIQRACSSGSLEGVCTILNHVSRLLETEYCPAIKQQLKQGYPSGYLDLTQAYNALQQGRLQASDPEQTKLSFLCYLNNADVSMEYTEKLKESALSEINRNMPKLTEREKEKISMCLSGLTEVSSALTSVIDYGMKQLKESAIKPRVNPWINAFQDYNHEMSEEDFNNYDAGDTFIQQLIAHIDGFLSYFKQSFTQSNYDTLVHVLATEIAKQLERVVLKEKYTRFGSLVIDRELRSLITFLASLTSWSVREKFFRLLKITVFLNLETLSDVAGLADIVKSGIFQPIEIQKILRRRTDFSSEDIDQLPPKKKKLTKKEKQRLADEHEKMMKAQAEQERHRQLKEEKERMERERIIALEKAKREVAEQELRCQQLAVTCCLFNQLRAELDELETRNRAAEEWKEYMKCDGLPDPMSFSQMNTYLFLWTTDDSTNGIDNAIKKTDEVLQLLSVMDGLIMDPPAGTPSSHIKEWKEIRKNMRLEQQRHLDTATYRLLRNIEHNLERTDQTCSTLLKTSPHLTLSLWAGMPAPISLAQGVQVKQIMTVEFPEVGVSCSLPPSTARHDIGIRALWLKYDHCSDMCPSFDIPPSSDPTEKDLNEATLEEWELKSRLQLERDNELKTKKSKGKRPSTTSIVEEEPEKSISDILTDNDEASAREWKNRMRKDTGPHQVNLRKYCVLGGVLHVDLLEQPPQPHDIQGKYTITILDTPPGLNPVDYYEHYVPPPPPEPGTRRAPEEIEIEVKKHEEALEKLASVSIAPQSDKKMPAEELRREMEKERQLQKLVVVSAELPESVLWFEPPLAANWDPVNNYWSTEEIHDVKFNEDKQTLTFRSGRMGLIGLLAYRYCNLPYQSWELKPDFKGPPGGVVLTITAAVVILEFIIREDRVCLSQLQNGATNALQDIVGTFYKPKELMKRMQVGGVDVFPPPDANCYVEGSTIKHRVAEDHLYHCMALFSTSYNFAWSRWNLLAGPRNMVIQMRESLDRKRLPNHSVVHVTPLRAALVNCTEVSSSFNDVSIEGMPFYADLYNLVMDQCSKHAKKKIEEAPFTLVETVFFMLRTTKPLCFS